MPRNRQQNNQQIVPIHFSAQQVTLPQEETLVSLLSNTYKGNHPPITLFQENSVQGSIAGTASSIVICDRVFPAWCATG